ncbi:MAG: hypothetical protein WAM77_32470 [Xanthobacteraceae bacterium]|jgi:hypothetical protein
MRAFAVMLVLAGFATAAQAQDGAPDLKGTWSGKGKAIVFGNNQYHPGQQTANDAPRIRDIDVIYTVDGQDGRLVWGHASSSAADTKEPFAWAIASDNKTILGSDTDGSYLITVLGPDRMEKCYTHNGMSPSKSIVAACHVVDRKK